MIWKVQGYVGCPSCGGMQCRTAFWSAQLIDDSERFGKYDGTYDERRILKRVDFAPGVPESRAQQEVKRRRANS